MSIIGEENTEKVSSHRLAQIKRYKMITDTDRNLCPSVSFHLRSSVHKRLFQKFGRGFTIVEIIVILAIVALVMGMAIPQFAQFGSASKLRSAVRQIVNVLYNARSSAVTSRKAHTVVFDVEKEDCWIEAEGAILDKKYHLFRPVNILSTTFKDNKVTFNSMGSSDARGKITLSDKRGNVKEIMVIDVTGAVRVK